MSKENKEEKEKTNEIKEEDNNNKQNIEEKKPENDDAKLEERKKRFENEKNEELDKKIQRAQRFGLSEKEDIKNTISSKADLDKRKERFKEQLEEIEGEEKEKEKEKEKTKGERGRIIHNNLKKKNNYRNNFYGQRRTFRDFKKGGFQRRIRGDRRNNAYKK